MPASELAKRIAERLCETWDCDPTKIKIAMYESTAIIDEELADVRTGLDCIPFDLIGALEDPSGTESIKVTLSVGAFRQLRDALAALEVRS